MNLLETFFILFQTSADKAADDAGRAVNRMAADTERADARIMAADAKAAAVKLEKTATVAAAQAHILAQEGNTETARAAQARADTLRTQAKLANSRAIVAASQVEEVAVDKVTVAARAQASAWGVALGAMVSIGAALLVGRKALELTDEYKGLQGQITLATHSTEEFNIANRELFRVAQDTRTGLGETVGLYASLSRSTQALGVDQTRLLAVTETINKAFIVSRTPTASAQAALVQLGQAFASGTLRGDELNSVLEQAPRLATAVAAGLGVTVGKLREMGAAGKLTSEQVFKAIESQGGAIAEEFRKIPPGVDQSSKRMANSILRFVGEMDKALGWSTALANGITNLSRTIDNSVGSIDAIKWIILGIASAITAYLIPALVRLAVAMAPVVAEFLVLAAPFIAIGAALIAIGTIIGIVAEDINAFLNGQPSLLGELAKKYQWVADTIGFLRDAIRWVSAASREFGETISPVLQALGPLIGSIMQLVINLGGLLMTSFGNHIVAIMGLLGKLFSFFQVAPVSIRKPWEDFINWLTGAIEWLTKLIGKLNGGLDGARKGMGAPGNGDKGAVNAPSAANMRAFAGGAPPGLTAGKQQMDAARTAPLATRPHAAPGARAAVTKSTTVKIEKVEVHTQATDADGMAKAATGALDGHLRKVGAHFDDGVEA